MLKKEALDSLKLKTDKSLLTAEEIGKLIGLERHTVVKYMSSYQYVLFGNKKKYTLVAIAEMICSRAV